MSIDMLCGRSVISLRNASSRKNLYQSQAPGRTAKPVRLSAWDCQPPPKSSHQSEPKTNTPPGPVFGTRSVGLLRDVLLLSDLHDAFAAVGRPQNADLIFSRMSFAFHGLGFFLGPD